MNQQDRETLEAAGWTAGDAEDFLGLTAEERRLVDLRAMLSRTILSIREAQGLTRRQLARKLKEPVAHVAAIETGGVGVTLDSMFLALFALGRTLESLKGKPIFEMIPDLKYADRTA
jgi:Helix-turn-helix